MAYLDFAKLNTATAAATPFPHVVCENFVRDEVLEAAHRDFPKIVAPGSFPLDSLRAGGAFAELLEELRGKQTELALAQMLNAAGIVDKPTMVTVRGFCRQTDGKIHLDSGGKLVTALLYLNRRWKESDSGGRLRLLNDGDNIENYFLEAPPNGGTLIAFRCDNNAWHGHLPFAGERRAIQLNWVASESYRRREASRHWLSAKLKKARRALFGGGGH